MMDQAREEVSWLTETDGKVASKPGEHEALWPIPVSTSCSKLGLPPDSGSAV